MSILSKALRARQFSSKSLVAIHYRDHDSQHPRRFSGRYNRCGEDWDATIAIASGIGLQNVPEGLAVSLALLALNYSRFKAFLIGALTGLVEPIGGLLGGIFVGLTEWLLPWGLLLSAGAMIYVISHEIIPETHREGEHSKASGGLMVGLVIMLFLDVWLG